MLKRPATPTTRPYQRLHAHLRNTRKRHRWWYPALAVAIISGLISLLFNSVRGFSLEIMSLAVLHGVLGLSAVAVMMLIIHNLNVTEAEEPLVTAGMAFLTSERLTPGDIETIDARAEVGSAAGQVRTIIPVVALPIVIALVGTSFDIATTERAVVALIFMLGVVALLQELDRANTDAIIRQSIAEYRGFQRRREELEDVEVQSIKRLLAMYTHNDE